MSSAADGKTRHFPLNGLDLSFSKYHHRPLDAADILACQFMDRLLPARNPARSLPPSQLLESPLSIENLFGSDRPKHPIFRRAQHEGELQERPVYKIDTLELEPDECEGLGVFGKIPLLFLSQSTHGGGFRVLDPSPNPDITSTRAVLLAVLRRYVFETSHPEIRPWLRWHPHAYHKPGELVINRQGCCPTHRFRLDTAAPFKIDRDNARFFARATRRTWDVAEVARLYAHCPGAFKPPDKRLLSHGSILQDARGKLGPRLWAPGPTGLPPPVPNVTSGLPTPLGPAKVPEAHLPVEPGAWAERQRLMTRPYYPYSTTLRTRRARSEPPPGAYILTAVPDAYARLTGPQYSGGAPEMPGPADYLRPQYTFEEHLIPLYVPCPALSEIDHRMRSRSLSRRHVARMFHSPSWETGCVLDTAERPRPRKLGRRCGWCGSYQHMEDKCGVAKSNRCKCRSFPMYHTAKECPVVCSRPCVTPESRQKMRHDCPAMMCNARCCMCGIRGHSGRKCHLKSCRCGEQHLGQDCTWKPECRVKGCDRYLCGMHCRECGTLEKPFVGGRCRECLANGAPVGKGAENGEEMARKARKKRERKEERREKARAEKAREDEAGEGEDGRDRKE